MSGKTYDEQLKEICQITGANWAVWLERGNRWTMRGKYNLKKGLYKKILHYLDLKSSEKWINKAFTNSRDQVRIIDACWELNCQKLYIFPDQMTQRAILVGASRLTRVAQRFWQKISLSDKHELYYGSSSSSYMPEFASGISAHLPEALNHALELILNTLSSKCGWLAIRSGDHFEIKAITNSPKEMLGKISITGNPLVREIVQNRDLRLVGENEIDWAMVPCFGLFPEARYWVALPLNVGRRIIGLIGLWLIESPSVDNLEKANKLVAAVANSVEGSIVFNDLTDHLRRMALLNDFSVTISSSVDIEQIVQRIFALINRAFETERIILIVPDLEESLFHQYYLHEGIVVSQLITSIEADKFWPFKKNEAQRIDRVLELKDYWSFYQDSSSAIFVPLKYHRKVIGLLGLESTREGAFTPNDENLLAILASHLAGLLENSRLRKEAEARAINLSLIHSVVENVVGLTDVNEIAQIAAELIAKNFAYELACIVLLNSENEFRLIGIGGSAAAVVRSYLLGQEASHRQGIVGRVVFTGESVLANDVSQNPIYTPLPGWEAASEMCVPLKDGGSILGVIDVESRKKNTFTTNDVLVMKSLAGILASVISKTGQYQKLQLAVEQLQNTRVELQERITAQRVAESRLIQAAKLAAVGEMAAGIAHELNNPLTTVSGFTELALEGLQETTPIRADLELVLREAQRARGVVRRLLDFARQSESVRIRSDINEIIIDVLNLTQHLLHTSGILLMTNLADALPWPSVDRNQIKQVILNLIHNSMQAMPTGGTLIITSEKSQHNDHDGVNVIISDTGLGISPELVERIFEPFFTTRSKEGGTGLGLSVSYGIVVDHGGDIFVNSIVGSGSTFTVWLPVQVEYA